MKAMLMSVAAVAVLSGCAGLKTSAEDHAKHHPPQPAATATAATAANATASRADQQMKMMQEMHQKMMAAKTPQERQALMAEHMKAMQSGMSLMCEMGQMMGGGAGQPGMGTPPAAGAPSGATQPSGMGMGMGMGPGHQDMMQRCMAMRDMTTRMMMERDAAPK